MLKTVKKKEVIIEIYLFYLKLEIKKFFFFVYYNLK
jgi:hypothetical protein